LLERSHKFLRYLIIGGINAAVTYSLFLFLVYFFGIPYIAALWIAAGTWVWWGFELQRVVVFRVPSNRSSFGKFMFMQILVSSLSSVFITLLVELGGLVPMVAYAISMFLSVVGLYLASLTTVFNSSSDRAKE
jgi:putative flippase GtrA